MKQDKSRSGRGITIVAYGHPCPQPRSKAVKGRVVARSDTKVKLWLSSVQRACGRALSVVGGSGAIPELIGKGSVTIRMQFRFGYNVTATRKSDSGFPDLSDRDFIGGIPRWVADFQMGRKRKIGHINDKPFNCKPEMPNEFRPEVESLAKLILNALVKYGVLPNAHVVASLVVEKVWTKPEFNGVTVHVMPYRQQFDPVPWIGREGCPCEPETPIPDWMRGMQQQKT
jgi:hypothetical protein